MTLSVGPMKQECSPCLSPKEMKKKFEKEREELKATINYLARNQGFDREGSTTLGALVARFINVHGPLK